MSDKRQALVVGISQYEDERPLQASAEDARRLTTLLQRNEAGDKNWTVTPVFDGAAGARVTARDLRARFEGLFGERSSGQEVLLYFAGHARATAWGAELLAYDGPALSFNDLMTLVDSSPATTVTVILDCCLSGEAGNVGSSSTDHFRLNRALLREGVTVLTASRPREDAEETPLHGLFTQQLLDGLSGTAGALNGDVTALGLHSHAAAGIPANLQRPTLKSHTVHATVVRKVRPRVDPVRLEQITTLFPHPRFEIRLDLHYEGVADDEGFVDRMEPPGAYRAFVDGSAKQNELDHLKEWRDGGLVRGTDGKDFYTLCLHPEQGVVALTPLGRTYWGLAKNDEIDFA